MRKLRYLQAGACYHVTIRTNRKELLLRSVIARDLLVTAIVHCQEKHQFVLDNFCIMENHLHLLITPGQPTNLSCIMKWLLGVYTLRYNKKFETSGRIWGGRYYSRQIRHFQDYILTNQYIDHNPVKAGLATHCRDWSWSACHHRSHGNRLLVSDLPAWLLMYLPEHCQLALPSSMGSDSSS
ncbi:MAG: transposase [Spirochaetes bacterium]|nr:transposase [Spirochaetota bacterium]MBU0955475.1 transposase [Spirochaetota bacterium]